MFEVIILFPTCRVLNSDNLISLREVILLGFGTSSEVEINTAFQIFVGFVDARRVWSCFT